MAADSFRAVEITCAQCGGHLGHVFHGQARSTTNERHCVNSVSIRYVDSELPADTKEAALLGWQA